METVISYEYDKITYWGTHEGLARGLPTTVIESDKSEIEIKWGLKDVKHKIDVRINVDNYFSDKINKYIFNIIQLTLL